MSQSTSETKIAISPKSKYAVTYENNLFKGWSNAEFSHAELTIEPQSTLILDFKVSDNKVLIYKTLYEVRIYDMENNEHIILYDRYEEKNYKITNFLTNGDIIIYKNAVASIYSSNNNWKCTSKYKFDEINIEFGGVANDRLWVIVNKTIHILDLNKFHYQKIPLEIDEKEINIDKITLKISECLIVINIDGKSYIYSNGTNVPIVPIRNKEPQDFDIIDIAADDIFNKYIITKSIDTNNKIKKIDIYDICCWKSSLRKSIDFDKLLESKNIESNQFIYKEVKNNKIFGLYSNKPRNIDIDMSNNSHSNNSGKDHDYILQETNDDNIFHRIGKQLITPIEDRDPFIKDCVIPHLKSLNIFQNVEEHDYDLELTGKDELHIYAFTKLKKIQLLCCYNIKFIKCTIKLYNNSELNSSDIDKITKHTENDYLKKQWISYLLNHKYFLVNYGERLLNSAIKENNTELVETIINKTLEYLKKDPNHNIYILSIISNNIPYLDADFLLKYYNEMVLFIDSSNQNVIYNNFDHLHTFCKKSIQLNFIREIPTRLVSLIIVFCVFCAIGFLNLLAGNMDISIALFILTPIFTGIFYVLFMRNTSKAKQKVIFVVPFPNYLTYPKDYNKFKEFFFIPKSNPFSQSLVNNDFYKTWNGEAIINFKWRVFASSVSSKIISENKKELLLISSIILGLLHLSFEIRQFIWNPVRWILYLWNWIDLGAYLLPTVTSFYWIYTGNKNTRLLSISCLLLNIKFLLFFRVFERFGIYFAIIVGVGPNTGLDEIFNPWTSTPKYHRILENGEIDRNPFLVQEPDDYTNLFSNFPNSMFSMYLFLLGDRNSLTSWPLDNNPVMAVLMGLFSFVIVIYLMNLFIGLLNMAIQEDNNRASYLAQKAEILKEIELFYLFSNQRRWSHWFPDIIYYYADVDETLFSRNAWNGSSRLIDSLRNTFRPGLSPAFRPGLSPGID
ncbi:hypothetical protein GLOIN_2v1841250 [Rhizophagus irregularis DAOM 181602=DAOM 197198]|nr:hypothetical protein GLOIN_2v1841250 [Rhizophagus irregularis DAOM 181602=DAOM 197198]